tara:strand:+ start:1334 stop:1597 length:264 start_codon:yes stop_codon:yes gene_type:complete
MLKICNLNNADQYFYIDKENANKLEVFFNLTEKGKEWNELGNYLYNFSIGIKVKNDWRINNNKFHFLRNLTNEKNIEKHIHKNNLNI